MNKRVQALAHQITDFKDAMLAFVNQCPEETWKRTCADEDWTGGVVARHVAAGHFRIIDLAQTMLRGEALPALTMEQVIAQGNAHARDHGDCTREEVLQLLEENGQAAVDFLAGLTDADLDSKGHLDLLEGDVTVEQLVTFVLIHSGGDHLSSMKTAAG